MRGLVFKLDEKNGVVKRSEGEKIVKLIPNEERKKMWSMGIKIGRYHIYLPKMLKPKAVEFRVSLWKIFYNLSDKNIIPKSVVFGGSIYLVEMSLANFLTACNKAFKETSTATLSPAS